MKRDHYSEKKRKAAAALAIVLAIAMVLSIAAPFFGQVYGAQMVFDAPAAFSTQTNAVQVIGGVDGPTSVFSGGKEKTVPNKNFDMDIKLGFDQRYIVEKFTPFTILVSNKGTEDFQGEIQLKVYSYEGSESIGGGEYSLYYQPIELPSGSQKEIKMNVPVDSIRQEFLIALADKTDTVIYSKSSAATAMDPGTILIGILTDHPENIQYLTNLQMAVLPEDVYQNNNYNMTVFLDQKTFPDDSKVLQNFKALIVNDFNTKELNEQQLAALEEWISSGGVLIIGTGVNGVKTMGGLTDLFPFSLSGISSITSYPVLSDIFGTDISGYGPMTICSIDIPNSVAILEEAGNVISSSVNMNTGKIIVHNFDLGMAPCSYIPDMSVLLNSLYTEESPEAFAVKIEDSYYYNYINNLAESIPVYSNSILFTMFAVLGVYILAIGPLLYVFLKKKDKREKGWVIIPAGAVLVTLLIFAMSLGSVYNNSMVSVLSVVKMEDGSTNGNADLVVGVRSPQKGTVTFAAEETLHIELPSGSRQYYNSYSNDIRARKILCGDTTNIAYFDNSSWGRNTFEAEKTLTLAGELKGHITIDKENFVGEITNETGVDLEDVVLSFGGQFQRLDMLLNGDTVPINYKIQDSSQFVHPVHGYIMDNYDLVSLLFTDGEDWDKLISKGILTRQEAFISYQRFRMITYMLDDSDFGSSSMPIKIYAFSNQPIIKGERLVNGKQAKEYHNTMYTKEFPISLDAGKHFSIPYGFIRPSSIDGENIDYGKRDSMMYIYSDSDAECTFTFAKDLPIALFQIEWNDASMLGQDISIFHAASETWEPMSADPYTNCQEYIDQEGNIRIRANFKGETQVEMPKIRIEGGAI